jgi:hypothetical protein
MNRYAFLVAVALYIATPLVALAGMLIASWVSQ